MKEIYKNRGRPTADVPPPQEEPVKHVFNPITPHICPKCGRGQTPTVIRTTISGERHVKCGGCGASYVYVPARTRVR